MNSSSGVLHVLVLLPFQIQNFFWTLDTESSLKTEGLHKDSVMAKWRFTYIQLYMYFLCYILTRGLMPLETYKLIPVAGYFQKGRLFFSEYGYRPHVTGVFGHQKRRFQKRSPGGAYITSKGVYKRGAFIRMGL